MPNLNFSSPKWRNYSRSVGSRVTYECRAGYVQEQPNNSSVICINKEGEAVWEGKEYLVNCVENYCLMPDTTGFRAKLIQIFNNTIPEGEDRKRKFSHQTALSFKCDEGFTSFENTSFTLTCDIYSVINGSGEWKGLDKICRGILFLISSE